MDKAGKRRKHNSVFLLIAVLFFSVCLPTGFVSRADSETDEINNSIKEKQNAISEAQQQKQALQSGLSDVKKLIDDLQKTKSDLNGYVEKLDANLNKIENKIAELKELIKKKEEEIKESEKALKEAEETEEKQYAAMKLRTKFIYEQSRSSYLELFFSSKSFGDLLNKIDYVERVTAYDRQQLKEYQETKKQIENFKQELEAEKIVLDAAKDTVEEEQANVNALIKDKQHEIQNYEADIGTKEQQIKAYEAEIASQTAAISALEQAVAEEKKRLEAANSRVIKYDGGQFKWPAPSYTRISDDYGNRMHPILGVQQFHNGVDMAAPNGSPILAAYDGDVVAASYSGSMGNYIMIDHGDGLYTIYMHASALYVSKGQSVSRGEKIAAVGSTGRSTGPHLHFSVRLNGGYVSPWNYLSQ